MLWSASARRHLLALASLCFGWLVITVIRQGHLSSPSSSTASESSEAAESSSDVLPAATEGRYRGQQISDLWAKDLPEQTWFTDRQCGHYVTRFTRDDTLKVVRLASFPRSGNTWARYLLEAATGVFTSSGGPNYNMYHTLGEMRLSGEELRKKIYNRNSVQLTHMGFLGEIGRWTQGNTLAMKTHSLPQPWEDEEAATEAADHDWAAFAPGEERKAVLLIRDPFKAFISLQLYSASQSVLNTDGGGHVDDVTGHDTANSTDVTALFRGETWFQFITYYAQHWYDLNSQWLTATNATLVVAYERMRADPMAELRDLLNFLAVEPDPGRLECVRRHLEGGVHNTRHAVVPDDSTYPLWLRAQVWSRVHQLNLDLKERGYLGLPLESYSFADEFLDIGL